MSFKQLTWGVKASFRDYVTAAEGSINLSDGAIRADDGTFVFAAVPGGDLVIAPDGSATGTMRFEGTVTFEAHGGMLKATLSELGIEAGADGLMLTALEAPMNKDRCAIAQLSLIDGEADTKDGSKDVVTLRSEITFDGMYQIADNYPQGTELDRVRLERDSTAERS